MLESSRKQLLSMKFWKILFSDDVNENMMMLTTFSKSAFQVKHPAGEGGIPSIALRC